MLKQRCDDVDQAYPALHLLIKDMWATMYNANGCGLAAPQVGHPIRFFLIDSLQAFNEMDPESRLVYFEDNVGIRQSFLNPEIIERSARTWKKMEACLSIPEVQGEIERAWCITIRYMDEEFQYHTKTISGITARMIQHEFDHINGVLFTDRLSSFSRSMLKRKLKRIARGKITPGYPMICAK